MSRPSADQSTPRDASAARDDVTPPALPDIGLAHASPFVAVAGLVVDELSDTCVRGHLDLGAHHHTPWGIVNGGVYTTAVESAASIGASAAVADQGRHAVAVNISTDFLRPRTGGRADVLAEPLHQGRNQQLWAVTIRDEQPIARAQVRLRNVGPGQTL